MNKHTLLPFVAILVLASCEKDAEEVHADLVDAPDPNTVVAMSMAYTHNGAAFDTSMTLVDAMGTPFKVSKLRFYMSRIAFTDDNGDSVAAFPDKYLLVELADGGLIRNIGQLSGHLHDMSFGLGVDAEANHTDPALYDHQHPLAEFDLWWGWAVGRLFLTVDGRYDYDQDGIVEADTSDRNFSYHCGMDTLYTPMELQVHTDADMGGNVVIPLDLNIDTLMAQLNIAGDPVIHEVTPITRALMDKLAAGLSHVE